MPKRLALRVVYLGLLAITVPVALARLMPFQMPYPLSAAEAEALWVLMPAWLGLATALACRHRYVAAVFGVLALVHVGWAFEWVPRVTRGEPPAGHRVRVVSVNLLAPALSPSTIRTLLEADADVILVQELSDEWDALLRQSGVYDRYPHRVTEPHPLDRDYFGIGILSRLPLVEHEIKGLAYEAVPFARADVEVGGRRVRFYSIHTMPPMSGAMLRVLGQQAGQLEAMLRADYADPSLAAVVAGGDFNASPTSYVYRRLRATGATAAHEAAGRGLALTWPNGLFLYPPMRLDHLFVHGVHVAGVRELDHGASDHSPLAAELVLPGAP